LELLKQNVDAEKNKDDDFYTELIRLMSTYLDGLYFCQSCDLSQVVIDENGDMISQDFDELTPSDVMELCHTNRELSNNLFEYTCELLEKNQDVKLDIDILKRLLNRNPKLFSLSIEQSYI